MRTIKKNNSNKNNLEVERISYERRKFEKVKNNHIETMELVKFHEFAQLMLNNKV